MKKIKVINIVIVLIFICNILNVKAQNNLKANMLKYDSAYVAMQNFVRETFKKYDADDTNYTQVFPDSIAKKIEETWRKMEKRELEIEKICQNQLEVQSMQDDEEWNRKADSLILLKNFEWKTTQKIGLGIASNQGFFTLQFAFMASWFRNFDIGIGSGLEYVNRGSRLVEIYQMPFYITNKVFFDKYFFLNFDYGVTIPIAGIYRNSNGNFIDFKDSDLKSNVYFDIGLGGLNQSDLGIQINFRNQSLGVPDPLNQRAWMLGVKLSF